MKEKSGLLVEDFRGPFRLDSTSLYLPNMYLKMPGTELAGSFQMEMNAFDDNAPGRLYAQLSGHVTKSDLKPFLTSLEPRLYNSIPNKPLTVQGHRLRQQDSAQKRIEGRSHSPWHRVAR